MWSVIRPLAAEDMLLIITGLRTPNTLLQSMVASASCLTDTVATLNGAVISAEPPVQTDEWEEEEFSLRLNAAESRPPDNHIPPSSALPHVQRKIAFAFDKLRNRRG